MCKDIFLSLYMGRQMSFHYLANFPFFLLLFVSLFEITNNGELVIQ